MMILWHLSIDGWTLAAKVAITFIAALML